MRTTPSKMQMRDMVTSDAIVFEIVGGWVSKPPGSLTFSNTSDGIVLSYVNLYDKTHHPLNLHRATIVLLLSYTSMHRSLCLCRMYVNTCVQVCQFIMVVYVCCYFFLFFLYIC